MLSDHRSTVTTPSRPSTLTNKRPRLAPKTAEEHMAVAFGQLTNVLSQKQSENTPAHKDDDCDLFAKLLAIKLRELPNDERKVMMYQIDGLFINRINQNSYARHTPSPQFQVYPIRPTSVNTVYSEPIHNTTRYFSSLPTQTSQSEPAARASTAKAPSQSINIISDQIVNPAPSEANIIHMALMNAVEDF